MSMASVPLSQHWKFRSVRFRIAPIKAKCFFDRFPVGLCDAPTTGYHSWLLSGDHFVVLALSPSPLEPRWRGQGEGVEQSNLCEVIFDRFPDEFQDAPYHPWLLSGEDFVVWYHSISSCWAVPYLKSR